MRIAVVHSYYSNRMPSGENVVVDLQVNALRRAGHDVRVISRRQEDVERSRTYPVSAALRAATNRGWGAHGKIGDFDPAIVHVNNLFRNFGRSWAERYPSRLVVTLHNYRAICAAGTLTRDGQPARCAPTSTQACAR